MNKDSERKHRRGPIQFAKDYIRHFSRYLVTGLLVWVPLLVTVWVSYLFITRLGFGLEALFKQFFLTLEKLFGGMPILKNVAPVFTYRTGFGFLTAMLIFVTTGLLTRYLIGRKIIAYGEMVLDRIPLISKFYRATQQIRDVFVKRDGTVFNEVCVVEYPRPGIYAVAFVTSDEQGPVQKTLGKTLRAVFVPTTPNPTSGYLIYLPPEEVERLDMTVEDAMKLIISGGAYIPGAKKVDEQLLESPSRNL